MQIFEVVELKESPFMETRELIQGEKIADVLTEKSIDKVYLLVDHDTKRIWTYNGPHSPFKVQLYGGMLAGMLRKQLRLFYRIYPLNMYSKDDAEFQEILQKPIREGRARPLRKEDFSKQKSEVFAKEILYVPLDIAELKKIVDDLEKQKITVEDFEKYKFLPQLKAAEKKFEAIMIKESTNELTIERQYLLEIVPAELVEISKDDGFPILKSFVIIYFLFRGISTNIFGRVIKLRKTSDKPLIEPKKAAYLYSILNLRLEDSEILKKLEKEKALDYIKLYSEAIIREYKHEVLCENCGLLIQDPIQAYCPNCGIPLIKVFEFNKERLEFQEKELEEDVELQELLDPGLILLFVDPIRHRVWIWYESNTTTRMKFIASISAPSIRDRFGISFKISAVDEGNEPLEFKKMLAREVKKERYCKFCGSKLTKEQKTCPICGNTVI